MDLFSAQSTTDTEGVALPEIACLKSAVPRFAESPSVPLARVPVVNGASPSKPVNAAYPLSAARPTQEATSSICYDFNEGARLLLPERTSGSWRARLKDLDTGNILFETENRGALVASSKKFYVRFGIEVSEIDQTGGVREIFTHAMDLSVRPATA